MTRTTIPIHDHDSPGDGCSACVHADHAPMCRAVLGQDCIAPQLSGPRDEVDRLMRALGSALGFRLDADQPIPVAALRVEPGEVELTLAVAPHCGGASLASQAFDTLRSLLPDTDIYVMHAA
jgi:hypothetical protein